MAQIFHRSTNTLSRVSIFGARVLRRRRSLWLLGRDQPLVATSRRPDVAREQPVPFSHEHHVGELGIDCRYCHTSVETSAVAGIPPTKTCMNCHSQIWTQSPMLEPVRASFRTDKLDPAGRRVHDLPDFVYFNHSVHVNKGVGCVDLPRPRRPDAARGRTTSLQMEWCLDCHRHPEQLRPPARRGLQHGLASRRPTSSSSGASW